MSRVWYTSDLHLGHRLVADLRGFDSVADHDQYLLSQFAEVVGPNDVVWVLGDLTLGVAVPMGLLVLPGTWHLVLGNHDKGHPAHKGSQRYHSLYQRYGFASVQTAATHRIKGRKVLLSHFPYAGDHDTRHDPDGADRYVQWRLPDLGVPILHGHTHSSDPLSSTSAGTPQVHVGLDAHNLRPVSREVVGAAIDLFYDPF